MSPKELVSSCTAIVVAFVQLTTLLNGCFAELKFVNEKYDGVAKIENIINAASLIAATYLKKEQKDACTSTSECPWYHVLEDFASDNSYARDVGLLFSCVYNVEKNGYGECRTCSAFYVGSDLLATAAHCIVKSGAKEHTKKARFFVHQFDGKDELTTKNAKIEMNSRSRVVTEWWIPEGYYNHLAEPNGDSKTAFEIAFLRVHKPKADPDHFYTLKPPGVLVKDKAAVLLIGYPGDLAPFRRAVMGRAKLYDAKDSGLATLFPSIPKTLKLYKASKLVHMVASEKGGMYEGASGGPVFEDSTALVNAANIDVIGVMGIVKKIPPHRTGKRDPKSQETELTLSAPITQELVDAMLALRAGKAVKGAVALPIPDKANKFDD